MCRQTVYIASASTDARPRAAAAIFQPRRLRAVDEPQVCETIVESITLSTVWLQLPPASGHPASLSRAVC